MKTKEIAKTFHLNQADFESFLLEIGANVKVGFTGMTLEDDVHSVVQKYNEYAERKKAARLEEEKVAAEAEEKKQRALAKMPITSGFGFDGYRIRKYSDFISGDAAVSIDRGTHGFFSSAANVNQNLLASLGQIRAEALTKLKEAAYNLGCNAVVGVDFDYITLEPETASSTGGTTYLPYVFCVTVNGNAVVLEKAEK